MDASICTRRKYQTPRKLTLVVLCSRGDALKMASRSLWISTRASLSYVHSSSSIFKLSLPARFQHLYWKIRQQFVCFQLTQCKLNLEIRINFYKSMKLDSLLFSRWFFFVMQAKNSNSFYFLLYDWYVDKYTYLQSKFLCIHISWEKEIIA